MNISTYIYIFVISFIISGSKFDILVFYIWSHRPPRHIHSTCPTNVYSWPHRVYIGAKPGGVITFSYYLKLQASFINMEREGSLDSSGCLLTKLHGIRPKLQLYLLQSHGFASQCFNEKDHTNDKIPFWQLGRKFL